MSVKNQVFLITVTVLEGRHYAWPNIDSAVIVKIDNSSKSTAVIKNAEAPYYNEYIVFEFYTTLEAVLEKNITITVVQPSNVWRKRKTLGYITLDVATVWQENCHQFYHKWAILSSPKTEAYSGPRGYLKLDISILAKGETPKIPANVINDDIEGNLLLPEGKFTERQKAKYSFDIYFCKNLVDKPTTHIKEKPDNEDEMRTVGPTTFIEISFAGVSIKTSTKKNTCFPEFNERLTIIDLFPPLSQIIKIEVCYGDSLRKSVHSSKQISLKQISNDKDEGFLPTLGPTYLHLYSAQLLEGYAGSILLAISTEIDEFIQSENKKGTIIQEISPIYEGEIFEKENVILSTFVYELTAISNKFGKKEISLRMTFGNTFLQQKPFDGVNQTAINEISDLLPTKITKNYYYLNFLQEKPCLWILQEVPYFKRRIYNSNMLQKIAISLKSKLIEIEQLFENNDIKVTSPIITEKLLVARDSTITGAKKYIDIVSNYKLEKPTKLDVEHKKLCLQEMTDIVTKLKLIDKKLTNKKIFRKLQKIYVRIDLLTDDVQICWPDVFIWLVHGKKNVACVQVPAKDIIFSPIHEERGQYCGVQRTICLYDHFPDKRQLAAKMEIQMFLCLERHKTALLNELPQDINLNDINSVPRVLTCKVNKSFGLRCYIFQGKMISGLDKSGLSDSFVRIIVQNQVKETKVIRKCLNPIWDETIIFSGIGIDEYCVPTVLMEVYDKDKSEPSEFIGRTIIAPKLSFQDRKYESIKLEWHPIYCNEDNCGEILCALEYIEIAEGMETIQLDLPKSISGKLFNIPDEIKPELVSHKMEVLFWGMRRLGKVNLIGIKRPKISILCGDINLYSDTIENAYKNPNFVNKTKSLTMIFPEQHEYAPSIRIKMYDSRRFGIYANAGIRTIQISSFMLTPLTIEERHKRLSEVSMQSADTFKSSVPSLLEVETIHLNIHHDTDTDEVGIVPQPRQRSFCSKACGLCWKCYIWRKPSAIKRGNLPISSVNTYEPLDLEDQSEDTSYYDWWTKFYASIEGSQSQSMPHKLIRTLKVYDTELENQAEFQGFSDMLKSFELYKGKRTGDDILDEDRLTGIFKGSIKIYKWPLENENVYVTKNGYLLEEGVFQNYPENTPLRFLLRVYCIRALGLRPKDLNGKSDPYLILKLNDHVLNSKDSYIRKNVNPVFGRCFEFSGTFPKDYLLKISVWDHDMANIDDLIGETEIDIENRYYTKHMASCGIQGTFEKSGYCTWRNQYKPTTILSDLCKKFNLNSPEYKSMSVKVGKKDFMVNNFVSSGDRNFDMEVLALAALKRWKEMPVVGFGLVPEHVETRSLYHPAKPGIEQGKLQIWIDIFPILDLPPPQKVDITVRKPTSYQLRVIVWNTDNIALDDDDFYSGEKKSDIYVKGWITDPTQAQYTDVHYRSLTGEGNFNWRFVFNFDYLKTENKIVIKNKELFRHETEIKMPCKLTLQVWDNDTFSKNDFIGTLSLELAKLNRPAKAVNKCSLKILEKDAPNINLFKIRRTKGWWPFKGYHLKTKKDICTGKIEAELELLTLEEAQQDPVGLGRHEPQALPVPKRPDTSFSWFKNPWKAFKFVACKVYKWRLLATILVILVVYLTLTTLKLIPGYGLQAVFHIH